MNKIVVGVDGSPGSQRALEWALTEAKLRSAEVEAVHGWTLPIMAGPFEVAIPNFDYEENAKTIVRDAIEEVTKTGAQDVTIHQVVVQQLPAQALIEASRDAALLVVGSRGHGGFAGLLLGSVGQECAHHALCPIVIVPHDRPA